MGKDETKDQLSYLEEERKKIWIDLSSLKNSFNAIKEDYDKDFSELKDLIKARIPDEVAVIKQATKKVTEYKNKIEQNYEFSSNKIKEIDNKLNEINSQKEKIEDMVVQSNEIFEKSSEIIENEDKLNKSILENQEKSDKILRKLEESDSTLIKIQEKESDIDEIFEKIDGLYQQILKQKSEVASKYQKIFGYKAVNKETGKEDFIPGTIDELNDCYKEIQTNFESLKNNFIVFEEKEKKEVDIIKNKIKALLPDAMTAGLAGAFEEKRKSEDEAMKEETKSFSQLLWAMAIIALIPFGIYTYWIYSGKGVEFVIDKTLNVSIAFIPLYAPFVWLAIHLNKKINLSKKLIEEYCYKETISKTVEGLSNQIKQVDDGKNSKQLHIKLLSLLLDTSADNPGKYITHYDKCDNPIVEALNRLEKMNHMDIKLPGGSECKIRMTDKKETKSAENDGENK